MTPSYLACLVFLSCATIVRDDKFQLCSPLVRRSTSCVNWHISLPSQQQNPDLHLPCMAISFRKSKSCFGKHQKFSLSFLLLLAGDVNLNPGPANSKIRLATANIRSIREKSAPLIDLVTSKQIDILGLTETWLKPKDTKACIADLTPPGYHLRHETRHKKGNKNGGGVGILISDRFISKILKIPKFSTFEAICCEITDAKNTFCFHVVSLYRTGLKSGFHNEFQELLENLVSYTPDLFMLGDFNFHMDIRSSDTTRLMEIIESFDLKQHVNFPTHISGHWLDLLITRSKCAIIEKVFPSDGLSDHFTVLADLNVTKQTHPEKKTIHFRQIHKIDTEKFIADINKSELITNPKSDLEELCEQYQNELESILDKHAPQRTKQVVDRPPNPWHTPEIDEARRRRRRLERDWRKNRTPSTRRRYREAVNLFNRLSSKAKSEYYKQTVQENESNSKQLWKTINKILHRTSNPSLPDSPSLSTLANSFATFFGEKIETIRSHFPSNPLPTCKIKPKPVKSPLDSFIPATSDEIRKLIKSSPSKSCDLDPIPTKLLKTCIDSLIIPITSIVNKSLEAGVFPSLFKTAHVNPLLKKTNLPKNDLKNYRPVSNLSFISKIVEKVVSSRLLSHMEENNLTNPSQSAYKKFHSTETVLLKLQNDITLNMENTQVTVLTLLDLSAAFDTIDHSALIDLLSTWFGISGPALEWMSSYLSDRDQVVKIEKDLSKPHTMKCGVPQGSVLGPILFTMYTAPLTEIINQHSLMNHQLYADDTQIYLSVSACDVDESLTKLKECLRDVHSWMTNSKLKLNPSKTELLLIGTKQQRSNILSKFPITILDHETDPSASARNLGVVFDCGLKFDKHVTQICKSCYYHIRDLRRIRRHLTPKTAMVIANSLVSSKLDYCNSLLYGIDDKDDKRLQSVQNSLARVVWRAPKFSHVTPILEDLHWLKIKQRREFKINTITYKTLENNQPVYLRNLLTISERSRTTRSTGTKELTRPPAPQSASGSRAFSVVAPRLWNELPPKLRLSKTLMTFRRNLKEHLFKASFPNAKKGPKKTKKLKKKFLTASFPT